MLQRIRSAKAVEKNKFSRITPTNAAEFGERSITFLLSQEEVDDIIAVLKVMIEESQPNPAHIRVMLDVRDLRFIDELIVLLRSL